MEKNNGKIAIALVAMFVVALSIVGVTYAYFTATIRGNTTEASVQVTAGVLRVNYAGGTDITATGIVPGWMNNGKMIYHPSESVNEDGHVSAVNIDNITDGTYDSNVKAPLHFTVTDDSTEDETAYYAIKLTNVSTTIADPANIKAYLYTTWDAQKAEGTQTMADNAGAKLANGEVTFAQAANDELIVSSPISITGDAEHNYYLVVEYANVGNQDDSQGDTFTATVEVVGLNLVGTDYKQADGTTFVGLN